MKKRIQIDGILLTLMMVVAVGFLCFPSSYGMTQRFKDVLDATGVLCVIVGAVVRMAARGHKKEFSQSGAGLVEDGPYRYVRNPMYLGTFLAGTGFTLLGAPVWMVPVFGVLFYLRFIRLIRKEESHLGIVFGPAFAEYCHRVPRIFPSLTGWWSMLLDSRCLWRQAWKTSEARMIFILPLIAVLVKIVTDVVVYRALTPARIAVYLAASAVYSCVVVWLMRREKG